MDEDEKTKPDADKNLTSPAALPSLPFKHVSYEDLNSRQQENFNFQKVSGVLAGYGFTTIRLSDDWNGADFLALHCDHETTLKVQLKGRLHFAEKYRHKNLWLCFRDDDDWYLYPHDVLLDRILLDTNVSASASWKESGIYHYPRLSEQLFSMLAEYKLT